MPSSETEFFSPKSVSEALGSIAKEDAIFLGGGTSTALLYKTRLIEPSRVVWLGSISELKGITISSGEVRIGAMTSMAAISRSAEIAKLLPGVNIAAGVIGNARVRAMATLGGALAHADPRQDVPPALIAVGAKVTLKNASGSRAVLLSDFYEGFLETVLASDELITEVIIPIVENRYSFYLRFTPTSEGDYPTVGAGCSLTFDNEGKNVRDASVVLCGVGPVPIVAQEAMNVLVGSDGSDAALKKAAALVKDAVQPHDDERGSAAYKREMSEIIAYRSLDSCKNS